MQELDETFPMVKKNRRPGRPKGSKDSKPRLRREDPCLAMGHPNISTHGIRSQVISVTSNDATTIECEGWASEAVSQLEGITGLLESKDHRLHHRKGSADSAQDAHPQADSVSVHADDPFHYDWPHW
jgi:hypothetical protein